MIAIIFLFFVAPHVPKGGWRTATYIFAVLGALELIGAIMYALNEHKLR